MRGRAEVEPAVALSARQIHERLAGLRLHTATLHEAVEARVNLDARLRSVDSYASLLTRLFGFYEPYEAELDRAVDGWELPIDFASRRKAPLIAADLAILGRASPHADGTQGCVQMPSLTSPAATLGCLYVTEGATLGGRLIARHIQCRLGISSATGASFFHGYGPETGRRWRTFCSLLAAVADSETAQEAIMASAAKTFLSYDRWLANDPHQPFA